MFLMSQRTLKPPRGRHLELVRISKEQEERDTARNDYRFPLLRHPSPSPLSVAPLPFMAGKVGARCRHVNEFCAQFFTFKPFNFLLEHEHTMPPFDRTVFSLSLPSSLFISLSHSHSHSLRFAFTDMTERIVESQIAQVCSSIDRSNVRHRFSRPTALNTLIFAPP